MDDLFTRQAQRNAPWRTGCGLETWMNLSDKTIS